MVNATAQVPERILLVCGLTLLAVSALLGFVQHRHRERPDMFARWRVVHNGGTAGAVQLLALGAVWGRLGRSPGGGGTLLDSAPDGPRPRRARETGPHRP